MGNEAKRLTALHELDILNGPREAALDQIARLAQLEFGIPHAGLMMVDSTQAIFVARANITVKSMPRKDSFCNITIQSDQPLIIPDTLLDPRCIDLPAVEQGIRSYAGFPLKTRDGYNVGSLCVLGTSPLDFPADKIAKMQELATLAMYCIELRRLAVQDHLTGCLNRRGFLAALDRHLTSGATDGVSLAMIDLDHFKQINDRFGHPVGDLVLQAVAALAKAIRPEGDLVGRLGGEEFAILLPGLTETEALPVIETLRAAITQIALPDLPGLQVSASFGIAHGRTAEDAQGMLAAADTALYQAKSMGRNRVVLATAPDPSAA